MHTNMAYAQENLHVSLMWGEVCVCVDYVGTGVEALSHRVYVCITTY